MEHLCGILKTRYYPTVSKLKGLGDVYTTWSKLNLAKAKENKDYYKKVRQELGLGARDPIPEKYKRPTKTHKPKVYEEIEKKEIVDPEEVEALKAEVKEKAQEQEKNKALGITKKDSEKTKREKELSRELKEQKLAKIVRPLCEAAMISLDQIILCVECLRGSKCQIKAPSVDNCVTN